MPEISFATCVHPHRQMPCFCSLVAALRHTMEFIGQGCMTQWSRHRQQRRRANSRQGEKLFHQPCCEKCLLSTGARLNEALQDKWKDVDRKSRGWRIDAAVSKSMRVRSVPLNDSAIEVLDRLDTEDKYEYLFINRKTRLPFTTIHKVWERLRTAAGLPRLRILSAECAFDRNNGSVMPKHFPGAASGHAGRLGPVSCRRWERRRGDHTGSE
jgi:integrase